MAHEHKKSSRRQFLTGRAAAKVITDAVRGGDAPLPTPAAAESRSLLVHVGREAMACEFEIVLNAGQYPAGTDAAVAALDLVDELEAQLTVYRDTSEVSRLNARAADGPVVVEERLFELFMRAKQLSEETGGAFDITSGPLTKVWGFYRRQGKMPSAGDVGEALALVGSRWMEVDEAERSVRFQKPGMEINLGAIGKGYSLDRCAGLLLTQGVADFMIHGGNSSVLACGARLREQPSGEKQPAAADAAAASSLGWSVALRHPLKPDQRLAEFRLVDQALGTSGSGTQYFHHQGKRYGHILDPRTGWPADKVLSSTVIAPTAAEADALSTALYVMGLEDARRFCEAHSEFAALLTTPGKRAGTVDLHPINLPDEAWRRLDA